MPLIAKGKIKGVLEVFHRTPLEPDQEWLDFLNTLAGQAGLSIDNYQLFDEIQRSNVELRLAYDTTIEGWSHALDLRDKETEGPCIDGGARHGHQHRHKFYPQGERESESGRSAVCELLSFQ